MTAPGQDRRGRRHCRLWSLPEILRVIVLVAQAVFLGIGGWRQSPLSGRIAAYIGLSPARS